MRSNPMNCLMGLLLGVGAVALFGCDPIGLGGVGDGGAGPGGAGPGGAGGGPGPVVPLRRADKVDILLTVDNSGSMADKQEILALALSDLVQGLTNPPCVDARGVRSQPANIGVACPENSTRLHLPVEDLHLGIISSSLGGHGAQTCTADSGAANVDMAHLLARSTPESGNDLPTYGNKGFLAWDPGGRQSPPGESDAAALVSKFKDMVLGVGQTGCGFEAPLESWYRFLADPEPYASISVQSGTAVQQGVDSALLQERAGFLRPDSLLVVLVLSDENDCSIRDEGQAYLAAEQRNPNSSSFHLWRPRSECAIDPNDPCCKSCRVDAGDCPADPSCYLSDGVTPAPLSDAEDQLNVRCFDQKRRFGFDFLYPVERYTQALTSATVVNGAGDLVPNPIFSDLDPSDGNTTIRDPGLVMMASVVGVPWQDLARDPHDLSRGYKSAAELRQPLSSGGTTWDAVLGDPANGVAPTDPLMIESIDPRSGVNPITGDPLVAPGSSGNPINGSERTIASRNDLQFACILPISPVECDPALGAICDCQEPDSDSPLCAPGVNGNSLQVNAKAYPGTRELSVLKGLGDQGVAASICPAQADDPTRDDYGYRPIVRALLERMAARL